MKFLIDRASFGPEVRKPCEEARKLTNGGYGVKLDSLDDLIELVKSIKAIRSLFMDRMVIIVSHFLVFTMTISSEAT